MIKCIFFIIFFVIRERVVLILFVKLIQWNIIIIVLIASRVGEDVLVLRSSS